MNEYRLMDRTYLMSSHYPQIYAKRSDSKGVGTRFIASHGAGKGAQADTCRYLPPFPAPRDAINRVPTPSALRGITLHIRHDPGTRLSREGLAYGFGHGNQRSISTSFEIADDSFNLWPHTTLGKMTLFVVPPGIS